MLSDKMMMQNDVSCYSFYKTTYDTFCMCVGGVHVKRAKTHK